LFGTSQAGGFGSSHGSNNNNNNGDYNEYDEYEDDDGDDEDDGNRFLVNRPPATDSGSQGVGGRDQGQVRPPFC
jgi:hypothetical protein